MDADSKKLLEETHALARDNNRMLRAIRRDAWFAFFGQLVIWVIVLLASGYIFQKYLSPYLGSLPTSAEFQKLVHSAQ